MCNTKQDELVKNFHTLFLGVQTVSYTANKLFLAVAKNHFSLILHAKYTPPCAQTCRWPV